MTLPGFTVRRIVLCINMWTALFQNAISAIPKKWACNANANLIDCVLEKSFSYMYTHTFMYIFSEGKLFSKTGTLNLTLALQTRFVDWRLSRFGKELFISYWMVDWIYGIYIYICNPKFNNLVPLTDRSKVIQFRRTLLCLSPSKRLCLILLWHIFAIITINPINSPSVFTIPMHTYNKSYLMNALHPTGSDST